MLHVHHYNDDDSILPDVMCSAGAPWDMVSRNFSATLINEALGMNLTQTDVITVSSMEDEALAQVVGRWNAMSTTKQVTQTDQCR